MTAAGDAGVNVAKLVTPAQQAKSSTWPTAEMMALWREHGGSQHGSKVETATIPLHLLPWFMAAWVSRRAGELLADRDRLAADFAAARAEVEAERRRYDEILKAADALRADAEAKDRRIAVLQGNLDRLEKLFWIELREPGKSLQRKGPFRCVDTAATLREFFAARPNAFMSVVSVGLDGPFFSDGPETLEMIDRRSRSVARRHRETTRAAFAARTAGGSDGRS